MDAEQVEIGLDSIHHRGHRPLPEQQEPLTFGLADEAIAELAGQRRAHRDQVVAGIEPLGDSADILAERLAIAQLRRAREHVHLPAGIVDVVFADDFMARELEQAGERIADNRAAAMAHMHRPGRVGRDIFDVHALAGAQRRAPIGWTERRDGGELAAPGIVGQREVDEAGTGDRSRGYTGIGLDMPDDAFRQRARVGGGGFGQHHGGVGGEVAMRGVARRFDGHAGARRVRRQRTLVFERIEHRSDPGG